MRLVTPYSVPYSVLFDQDPVMSARQEVRVRISLANEVTLEAVDALDSIVLPFFLLGTSGALAGENIAPWTSTIEDKSKPIAGPGAVEWLLKSCNLDDRSIVILAQMLLIVHEQCSIREVIINAGVDHKVQRLISDPRVDDPYPGISKDVDFAFSQAEELGKEISIRTVFCVAPSIDAQEKIDAELFSFAPGLVSGAYGVAPVSPDRCTGVPDEEVVYNEREMEWYISEFKAHLGALRGLINVFASISHKIAKIDQLFIE